MTHSIKALRPQPRPPAPGFPRCYDRRGRPAARTARMPRRAEVGSNPRHGWEMTPPRGVSTTGPGSVDAESSHGHGPSEHRTGQVLGQATRPRERAGDAIAFPDARCPDHHHHRGRVGQGPHGAERYGGCRRQGRAIPGRATRDLRHPTAGRDHRERLPHRLRSRVFRLRLRRAHHRHRWRARVGPLAGRAVGLGTPGLRLRSALHRGWLRRAPGTRGRMDGRRGAASRGLAATRCDRHHHTRSQGRRLDGRHGTLPPDLSLLRQLGPIDRGRLRQRPARGGGNATSRPSPASPKRVA